MTHVDVDFYCFFSKIGSQVVNANRVATFAKIRMNGTDTMRRRVEFNIFFSSFSCVSSITFGTIRMNEISHNVDFDDAKEMLNAVGN